MVRRGRLITFSAGLMVLASLDPAIVQASSSSLQTTQTALTSSSLSSTYDSSVTFTAQVSAAGGTPTGSVTFADESNGSVLDTTALTGGKASFSTAALATGARSIVARYAGTSGFAASASAPTKIAVAAAGADAVTYQVDPRHDGDQANAGLAITSLHRLWNVSLGVAGGYIAEAGDVSYPVIAGGRVFVTVENSQSYGGVLYALDATTGATVWSVGVAGTYGFSALAYDGQELFVINFNGVLTAFTASSGHELWSEQLPGQYSFTAPPSAYDGVVYAGGAGSGGTVYAVSEADGVVRWTTSVENGDKSSPAVDNTGVYVSYACQQDYRFKLGGALVWHHTTSCSGGGGSTAVLHGTSVYTRGSVGLDTPTVLSKSTGSSAGSFASSTAPAFARLNMYTLYGGNLIAVDPSGSPDHWAFGNGTLVTAPVVGGSTVFVGASSGTVYGVTASTGQQVWSGTAGSTIVGPDEQNADVLVGMAIGGGMLVVPAGNELSAFGS